MASTKDLAVLKDMFNKRAINWTPEQWVTLLKESESRGGSASLQKAIGKGTLKQGHAGKPAASSKTEASLDDWPSRIAATVTTAGAIFFSTVTIVTADGHHGTADEFSFALGGAESHGNIGYSSLDDLYAANKYALEAGPDGTSVQFLQDGTPVGLFFGQALGEEIPFVSGPWSWQTG